MAKADAPVATPITQQDHRDNESDGNDMPAWIKADYLAEIERCRLIPKDIVKEFRVVSIDGVTLNAEPRFPISPDEFPDNTKDC